MLGMSKVIEYLTNSSVEYIITDYAYDISNYWIIGFLFHLKGISKRKLHRVLVRVFWVSNGNLNKTMNYICYIL